MNYPKTIIYIDGANLYRGAISGGWEICYKRFAKWLNDKYRPQEIIIFLGYIEKQKTLYNFLQTCGFRLIFKETIVYNKKVKGNCDAELIQTCVQDFYEKSVEQAILISGDGDFSCLIDFWKTKNVKCSLLIPNKNYCSYLLRKRNIPIIFLENPRLRYKIEKTPDRD